jgi:hypothetical protein
MGRELYRKMGDAVERFGDPFRTSSSHTYFQWLNSVEENPDAPAQTMTRLWRYIYDRRSDVQLAYPDPNGVDREGFRNWTRTSGAIEHQIPPDFCTA